MMLRVLDPVLDKWVVVYLEDLLINSNTKAEHLQHLRRVLALLRKHGLYAKLDKCFFMQDETEFLGRTLKSAEIAFPLSSLHMNRRTAGRIPSTQTSHLLRPRPPHLRPHHHRRLRCIHFRHRCIAAAD